MLRNQLDCNMWDNQIKLITMCFGLTFKWSVATGIWLIICMLGGGFNINVNG